MPKLICPSCDGTFDTSGIRYTGCPKCGVKIDTRGADGPKVMSEQNRNISRLDDVDPNEKSTNRMDDAPKSKRRSRKTTSGGGKNSDTTMRLILGLLVGATVLGFVIVLGMFVLGWIVVGGSDGKVTVTSSSTSTPGRVSESPQNHAQNGNQQPGFQPGQFPQNGGNGGTSFPTPQGDLPGIDPAELSPPGLEQLLPEIEALFPPGTFPPGTFPQGPGQPNDPGQPGMRPGLRPPGIGNAPGRPPVMIPPMGPRQIAPQGPGGIVGNPGMPGAPGTTRLPDGTEMPETAYIKLTNLRLAKGLNPFGELEVDFQYPLQGNPSRYEYFLVKTSEGTSEVRAQTSGLRRGNGTARLRPTKGQKFSGPIQVWVVLTGDDGVKSEGQIASNTVTLGQ